MTAQHVKRVNDAKWERGIHRGTIPFGYGADLGSTKSAPLPPLPGEKEFSVVIELFARARTGFYTCQELPDWLNSSGFRTHNRMKTVSESATEGSAQRRLFTHDSVRGILQNPFYAGFVVKETRNRNGG